VGQAPKAVPLRPERLSNSQIFRTMTDLPFDAGAHELDWGSGPHAYRKLDPAAEEAIRPANQACRACSMA
jgi:hypothetical protein